MGSYAKWFEETIANKECIGDVEKQDEKQHAPLNNNNQKVEAMDVMANTFVKWPQVAKRAKEIYKANKLMRMLCKLMSTQHMLWLI